MTLWKQINELWRNGGWFTYLEVFFRGKKIIFPFFGIRLGFDTLLMLFKDLLEAW